VRGNRVIILLALVLVVGAIILVLVLLRGNQSNNGVATVPDANSGGGTAVQTTPTALPSPTPNIMVVAASHYIPRGTLISQADIALVPKASNVPTDTIMSDNLGAVLDHYNVNPIYVGQPIRQSDISGGTFSEYMRQLMINHQLEPGKKAFAFATNDLSDVAGLVSEGDLIDVVATFEFGLRPVSIVGPGGTPIPIASSRTEPTTKTLLENVRVLKVIQLRPGRNAFDIPPEQLPTPTAAPVQTTALANGSPVVAPATPVPTPTIPGYAEAGAYFPVTTVFILAVDDQQAELLKFARETRVSPSNCAGGGSGSGNGGGGGDNGNGGGSSNSGSGANIPAADACVPTIHFVLRAKPIEPSNPQDPNIATDPSRGITFRALVRDYGVPIPDLVFATQAQQ
jgi:Flp pilus assembly protein CpaB